MSTPKVKTFEDWLREYYPDWEDEEEVDCPECEGKGYMECPTCGADDTYECGDCKGKGIISNKEIHRDEYQTERERELVAWAKWTG